MTVFEDEGYTRMGLWPEEKVEMWRWKWGIGVNRNEVGKDRRGGGETEKDGERGGGGVAPWELRREWGIVPELRLRCGPNSVSARSTLLRQLLQCVNSVSTISNFQPEIATAANQIQVVVV
ncbi:hypothetical protein B0H13DRAFT_1867556 [Mycena leptocephala]|nr:hypothetical protein B0H13DRAFT_1867556 [Mycena leptocephala]